MIEVQDPNVSPRFQIAQESVASDTAALPLCVDLDGTLIETDCLLEGILALVKQRPWMIFVIPFWALAGKSLLKRRVAEQSPLDVTLLPVNRELMRFLEQERERGRMLVLATATHRRVAYPLAEHLGMFEEVFASDDAVNLRGREKSRVLCARFGRKGFAYVANAYADLPIWRDAAGALLVNTPPLLARTLLAQRVAVQKVFTSENSLWKSLLRACRVHQWAKNLLVFAPLLLSHNASHPRIIAAAAVAFLSFSLCASGVYLLNDLLDLESDRRHPRKRLRPLASGELPIHVALAAFPLLTAAAFILGATVLPGAFTLTLLVYWIATLAYSFWIKGQLLVDVIMLAALYTIRIVAGGTATAIPVSPWTLGFSVALFLSLALVKRYSELRGLEDREETAHGRAYYHSDSSILAAAGLASGYMSIVVMALYINSPEVTLLYSRPMWLWPLCLVQIYFVSRFWLLAHRGLVQEDPVIFAFRDRANLALGAISLAVILFAI